MTASSNSLWAATLSLLLAGSALAQAPSQSFVVPENAPVAVEQVDDLSSEGIGLSGGAFSRDAWNGTSRKDVENFLALIDSGSASPSLRALTIKLLIADTEMPPAKGSLVDILALRIQALAALGANKEIIALLAAIPPASAKSGAQQVQAETLLLQGDSDAACKVALHAVEKTFTPAWQQWTIYCQALAGKSDEAELGLAALREQENIKTHLLDALVTSLTQKKEMPITIENPALPVAQAAMLLKSGLAAFTLGYVNAAPLQIVQAIAQDITTASDIKLAALEKSTLMGTGDINELMRSYTTEHFSEEELASAKADKFSPARWHALLYQRLATEKPPQAQIALIAETLAAYQADSKTQLGFKILLPAARKLSLQRSNDIGQSDSAFALFRILLAAGKRQEALLWLEPAPKADPIVAARKAIGEMLLRLADNATVLHGNTLPVITLPANASATDVKRLIRLYSLLEALGYSVPDAAMQPLKAVRLRYDVQMPSATLLTALEKAGKEGRKAEAVLLAAAVLDDGDLIHASDTVVAQAVKALSQVGFAPEAHALALEAALSY